MLFGIAEKCFVRNIQYFRDKYQLNIRDKSLACLNSLNSVLIDIQPQDLQSIGKFPLGFLQLLAVMGNLPAADVVTSIGRF